MPALKYIINGLLALFCFDQRSASLALSPNVHLLAAVVFLLYGVGALLALGLPIEKWSSSKPSDKSGIAYRVGVVARAAYLFGFRCVFLMVSLSFFLIAIERSGTHIFRSSSPVSLPSVLVMVGSYIFPPIHDFIAQYAADFQPSSLDLWNLWGAVARIGIYVLITFGIVGVLGVLSALAFSGEDSGSTLDYRIEIGGNSCHRIECGQGGHYKPRYVGIHALDCRVALGTVYAKGAQSLCVYPHSANHFGQRHC
jgi:hypothetical protein